MPGFRKKNDVVMPPHVFSGGYQTLALSFSVTLKKVCNVFRISESIDVLRSQFYVKRSAECLLLPIYGASMAADSRQSKIF